MSNRLARTSLVAVLLGLSAILSLQILPEHTGTAAMYALRTMTAAIAGFAMIYRSRQAQGRLRTARMLLALGLLAGSLNGVGYVVMTASGEAPDGPSVLDFVSVLIFPLFVAGMFAYPVRQSVAGSTLRSILDGCIAAAGLWLCVFYLVLQPSAVDGTLTPEVTLSLLAYPAAALFFAGMIIGVLVRTTDEARREVAVIGAGVLLLTAYSIAFSAEIASNDDGWLNNWVGALSEIGILLILWAAISPSKALRPDESVNRWLPLLPLVPAAAAICIGAVRLMRGESLQAPEAAAGLVLVVALLLRQVVGNRDRDALLNRLSRREQLFRSLIRDSSDLITLQDTDGRMKYASPAVVALSGQPEDVLLRSRFEDLIYAEDLPNISGDLTNVRAIPGLAVEFVCRFRDASGELRWTQTQLHNLTADPGVEGIVSNARDIHNQYLLEQRLSHAAYHDELTGLGNLSMARELLMVRCYGAPAVEGGVIVVDLDGFKSINDTFGHSLGDRVLQVVAERLRDCADIDDAVNRIGGDEFAIVLADEDAISQVVEQIMAKSAQPIVVDGLTLTVGASVGVAVASEANGSDELLRNADLAMYIAKDRGRNRASWFEPQMYEASAWRMNVVRGLRRALDDDNFALHYQPIVRLKDGAFVGYEALLRWDDPVLGKVGPDEFIGVAEQSGMISEIGSWVLERACADLAAWRGAGLVVPPVSVNVSRLQVTPGLPEFFRAAIERHQLDGSDLCCEITEGAILANPADARAILEEVRALGVDVVLDDFGTGQSAVSQLTSLPIDRVKIDKSFAIRHGNGATDSTLLRSIVSLCSDLGLPAVAEGIEDRATAQVLIDAGCEFGQGYYFSRPKTGEEFSALLRHRLPRQRANAWRSRPTSEYPRPDVSGGRSA